MTANKTLVGTFFVTCVVVSQAYAFDVVKEGQPVVTGEPSRVGPPWNHRSTFNIPGTNTDVAFGGYVKLDALYDFDYDLGTVTTPFNVLNPANTTDGRTSFTAAESRLNFRTQTQTEYGKVSSYFEGHFLPDEKFNLRHAYGEMNGFLAGQTWTNFMSFVGTPRTLFLGSPKGYSFDRRPQVRYTQSIGSGAFSIALEEPTTVIARADIAPDPNDQASSETRLPDLTMRYEYKRMFSFSGVIRELSTNSNTNSVDDQSVGYGVQAQASLPLTASTTLKSNVSYGSGIGNYMGNPGNSAHRNAPDVFVEDGELKSVDIVGYGVSLNQNLGGGWFTSVGYSRLNQDLPETTYPNHFDTVNYGFANVIWDVTDRVMVGLEYQYADVKQVSGDSDDASRLQASMQFQF